MARSHECTDECARKLFDTADIVREAIFHQVREAFAYASSIFATATIAL
jgi:hypothetical protein